MTNRVQFRVTYNDERGQDTEVDDSAGQKARSTNGRDFFNFRVRRAKTKFEGNIFEKEFKYVVQLVWTEGGDNIVEDAFFTWAKWKEFNVSGGQAKVPFEYQFNVSSGKQQFVDRSVVSNTFNQSWGKGIWLSGVIGDEAHTWVKYWVGIYNGRLRANNDFRNQDKALAPDAFNGAGAGSIDADLMPALRVETHPLGNVADDMTDMRTREESKKVLFSVGVALNWFISRFANSDLRPNTFSPGSGRSDTGHDTINLTLDGHFRFYGLSVNIEYIHRHTEFHNFGGQENNGVTQNQGAPGDLTDSGLLFEVGFFILPKQLDVGFRFGWVDSDEYWAGGSDDKRFAVAPDSTEIGLTVGYYLGGHNLKFQLDFTYISYQLAIFGAGGGAGAANNGPFGGTLPSRSNSSIAQDNADWLNVWQFRVQIQWIF
jgi:hypothetical protein